MDYYEIENINTYNFIDHGNVRQSQHDMEEFYVSNFQYINSKNFKKSFYNNESEKKIENKEQSNGN